MDGNFWLERWRRREIGFHQSDIHWALKRHWSDIAHECDTRVLVPLCGKSLDMRWLAQQGHEVVGIDLSQEAVTDFFREWERSPNREDAGELQCWHADGVTLYAGDFFAYRLGKPFQHVYDRAALIALPPDMRRRYLAQLRGLLADDARGLLVTFEYDQGRMEGPPFSVCEDELRRHSEFHFELLERRDVLEENPRFAERGLRRLSECAWLMRAE